MTAEERWAALVETMLAHGAATHGSDGAQRAFGSTSLKTDGKIFAMLVKDRLVVKLARRRVDELVEAGEGRRFDPGHGRLQKEWLDVDSASADVWLALATEAEEFVARRGQRPAATGAGRRPTGARRSADLRDPRSLRFDVERARSTSGPRRNRKTV
jgi:TfoX/Sxy family transcriptional regulator of competence genes